MKQKLTWVNAMFSIAAYDSLTFTQLHQSAMKNIDQLTVLVTGASSGIGYALALQLAQQGATVIAWGRNLQRLQILAAQHHRIQIEAVDISQSLTLKTAIHQLQKKHNIDLLIHNAAIQHACQLEDPNYDTNHILEEISTNLIAPIELSRLFLPQLRQQAATRILFISSGLALLPKKESAVYCASKAAIHSFAEALALQVRDSSIHVTEYILPLVDTPMTANRGSGKLTAHDVAERIITSLQEPPRATIYLGKAKLLPFLLRFAPWIARRALQT
ncbi:MAG: SDR family NAD(P)-dependent oxidoreductase [Undibacterium sp.]|nr:SDR family NAD(P)-dependent oxidoreductase [Undibacterium sp.]